jgi:hypothetical protein
MGTLKITITTYNVGGRGTQATRRDPLFCALPTVQRVDADGSGHRQTVRAGQAEGPATPRNSDDHVPSNLDDQK